ncbi:MAG: hypothetical protein AAFU79_32270, partial [Myxococcota bacterium]
AAADAVRTFLDEIDASEALTPESIEEGRRIAATMEQFLSGDGPAAEDDSTPAPPPEWAGEIELEPKDGAVAFRYQPESSCFFRGEDPLGLVAQVPDLEWRKVNFVGEGDPFECHLVLLGVTSAPVEDVRHLFRYVEDEVELWEMALTEGGADGEAPSDSADEVDEAVASMVSAVVAKQVEVLDAAEVNAVPSVREVLRRCFRRVGAEERAEALEKVRLPEEARAAIQAFLDDRRAASARRPAPPPARSSDSGSGSAAPGGAAPKEAAATGSGPNKVLRVEQAKVDRLMNLIGQLVVAKNGLPYLARRLETHGDAKVASRELKEHGAVVDRIARELQNAIMEVRMLPVSQVFQRFPRLVRDVSRKLDKQIELTLVGEETHADKNVIEALSEPLVLRDEVVHPELVEQLEVVLLSTGAHADDRHEL